MNKILKISLIVAAALLVGLYLCFLLVLPNVINLNAYKSDLQKVVKNSCGLTVDFDGAKIVTTPMLSAGVKVKSCSVSIPDDTPFLKTDGAEVRIALPSLIFKTVKVSYANINNPAVNIDIVDGNKYALIDFLEKNTKSDTAQTTENNFNFDFNVKVNKFAINNYSAKLNDLKSGHYLKLVGNSLILAFDGKNIKVDTACDLFSDEAKNISATIDVKSYLPEIKQSETAQTPQETPFINPVQMFRTYDLKSDINAKLVIKEGNNAPKITGESAMSLSMKISDKNRVSNDLNLKFNQYDVDINSLLVLAENQKLKISGKVNYSEKPSCDLKINSDKIYLANILEITKGLLGSFNVQNDLDAVTLNGYFIADANIKTDMKTLVSSGSIKLSDGMISDKKTSLKINNVQSLLSFENNNLYIKDTHALVNGTPFSAQGSINSNADADIKVYTKDLPLASLYSTFAPADIKNAYSVKNGLLDLNIAVKGNLNALNPVIDANVVNLVVKDNVNGINIVNGVCDVNIKSDLKTYQGKISNSNLSISAPAMGVNIRNSKAAVDFNEKDITILPTKVVINGTSELSLNGSVKNYVKSPDILINGAGNLQTAVLKNLAGKDIAPYLSSKGAIPVKLLVTGNDKKQNIVARMYGSSANYITPVSINEAVGHNSVVQLNATVENNKINIKDSGLFVDGASDITKPVGGKQLLSVNGAVLLDKNTTIDNLKISTKSKLKMGICAFSKSSLDAGLNITVFGTAANPRLNGTVNAENVTIPQLLTKVSSGKVVLKSNTFDFDLSKLNLNGTSLDVNGTGLLDYKPVITLTDLNIKSEYFDADKAIKVSEATAKVPVLSSGSTAAPSLPVKVKNGSIDIKNLKSGDIKASDITSKMTLFNNVVYLKSLVAHAYNGKLNGDVSMNIFTSAMKVKVSGKGFNANNAITDCAAIKNLVFGTLDFNANVTLKGATYIEQMRTLNGVADFTIKNGQFGTLGRFETFLAADNLVSVTVVSSKIGGLINKVSPHNTSNFDKLTGNVTFKNGLMTIKEIKSTGKNMSLYVTGTMNLVNNYANIVVLGRISPEITSLLGPLNQLNPIRLLQSNSSTWAQISARFLKALNQIGLPSEIAKIPALSTATEDALTSKFVVKINGNVERPQSAVKSFKWLSSQSDMTKAENAISPKETVKNIVKTIPQAKQEVVEQVKQIVPKKEVAKDNFKNMGKNMLKNLLTTPSASTSSSSSSSTTSSTTSTEKVPSSSASESSSTEGAEK